MTTLNDNKTIAVIDDDELFCDTMAEILSDRGIEVLIAHNGAEGLKICSEKEVDIVLLDQKLPDIDGVELCPSIRSRNDRIKVILITAYSNIDNAVQAIKAGAFDYLSKPFEIEELNLKLDKIYKTIDLEQVEQVHRYKQKQDNKNTILIGFDRGLREIDRLVDLAAKNSASVLITGETGTGKSIVAKSIYHRSQINSAAFISVNCAALPANMIEAELFGHEKGAFTGAIATRKGIFEMASGGVLFLDEIGALDLELQSKLLCVLDDQKVRRLGGEVFRPVDVRIIAATNIDLEKAVKEKLFREDLYYRLCVIRVHVPPLRERIQDIVPLSCYFMQNFAPRLNLKLDAPEIEALENYSWPGNVRELKNIIERSIILRQGKILNPSQFLQSDNKTGPSRIHTAQVETKIITLKEMERRHIHLALSKFSNCRTKAAKALGISRSTLKRKIKSYQLDVPAQIRPVA